MLLIKDISSNSTDSESEERAVKKVKTICNNESNLEDDKQQWKAQKKERGLISSYDAEAQQVMRYVRRTLFTEVKFVTSDLELYAFGKKTLSNHCMKELNVNPERQKTFWQDHAKNVYKALLRKRNNVSADVMKTIVGK